MMFLPAARPLLGSTISQKELVSDPEQVLLEKKRIYIYMGIYCKCVNTI